MRLRPIFAVFAVTSFATALTAAAPLRLSTELSAEEVLNGAYPWPPSPPRTVLTNAEGYAKDAFGKAPAPGVHPRILFSPDDVPGIRERAEKSEVGRALLAQMKKRLENTVLKSGTWEYEVCEALAKGDIDGARAVLKQKKPSSYKAGHYQPTPLYEIMLAAYDALLRGDEAQGKRFAAVIAGYAAMAEPVVKAVVGAPLSDDVWRAKLQGPVTGSWSESQGARDLIGYHLIGYAYDFAAPSMTDAQKDQVRRVISLTVSNRVWMGGRLPHHFRNWNWINVGLGEPLLALAIEGEPGSDPRVVRLGAEIARDYLSWGNSAKGSSTEAVGYTQFGYVWGNPFIAALARRGDHLATIANFRAMREWYGVTMEPGRAVWSSPGDGGDRGPSLDTMLFWNKALPNNELNQFLLAETIRSIDLKKLEAGADHLVEQIAWAADPAAKPEAASLGLPLTWYDAERGALNARTAWSPDAAFLRFDCRPDSVGASHEHADRGAFTFSALGRTWARDYFRSVEGKFHNTVLIDGFGQGFWPGPGNPLGATENADVLVTAAEFADAYRWWWPKQVLVEDAKWERFQYDRWATYGAEAAKLRSNYPGVKWERDPRPSVVRHWKGYEKHDPRMWDEDGWPVRAPHVAGVTKAFRTLVFRKGDRPWLLTVDDLGMNDKAEHEYDWQMMTGADTDVAKMVGNEITLCDANVARNAEGAPQPKKGDRLLLVRAVRVNKSATVRVDSATAQPRLETIERRDSDERGGRSYGIDKRLVVSARAAEPGFVMLLAPIRQGEEAPRTAWSADGKTLTVTSGKDVQKIEFTARPDGRTGIKVLGDEPVMIR